MNATHPLANSLKPNFGRESLPIQRMDSLELSVICQSKTSAITLIAEPKTPKVAKHSLTQIRAQSRNF
jgi:hypothetical protein